MDKTEILNTYYANNAWKLHKVVDEILQKFGGISNKDIDDFYSLANEVFTDIINRYDYSKSFNAFLYSCLLNKIKTEMTKRNREKRKADRMAVSIDTPIGDDENSTLGDMLPSDFNVEEILLEKLDEVYNKKIEEYLRALSDMQQKIVKLIMYGYSASNIKELLHLTDKQYQDSWNVIRSYDKKRILCRNGNMGDDEMDTTVLMENVTETYKDTSYSIDSISKQLRKNRIRDDHILQRHSGQWKSFAKSELISDILRGKSLTQIIISEEIKNGVRKKWLIDGKQRCTTLDDFLHDGFAVSKNIKNYNIRYQADKKDEDGNKILTEEGFADVEFKEFDIRGKKFSQLPEELQDVFKDRQIPVLYNMDCTKKDIAEDIARFNRSRPMNKAQNGWLGLEESFAEFAENIAKMQFFQPEFIGSSYTKNSNTSGAIRRIVIEGIMVSDFIDDFCNFDKMCEFLSEEASDSNFIEFYSLVERLTLVCNTKKIASLFNVKDSFLWFGLFSKFVELGLEDKEFAEFLNEFETLRKIKVDGKSFDDILSETKSTKEKSVVIKKMNHLEKLMTNYLCGDVIAVSNEDKDESVKEVDMFISDMVGIDIDQLRNNMSLYVDMLDGDYGLKENCIKDGSKLLDKQNSLSLLTMVVYAEKIGEDLDDWLRQYAENNNTYFADQKKNFLYMKENFEKFNKCQKIKIKESA